MNPQQPKKAIYINLFKVHGIYRLEITPDMTMEDILKELAHYLQAGFDAEDFLIGPEEKIWDLVAEGEMIFAWKARNGMSDHIARPRLRQKAFSLTSGS